MLRELMRWEGLVRSAATSQHAIGGAIPHRVMATNAADTATDNTAWPCHHIPFLKNGHFVGREETLDLLNKLLFVPKEGQRAAVARLGSVGKTQVAFKFALSNGRLCSI
jgi:hypothetical protein